MFRSCISYLVKFHTEHTDCIYAFVLVILQLFYLAKDEPGIFEMVFAEDICHI